MIELERDGDVFVLTMAEGENRWNTTFTRAFAKAIDEVEASEGPAALVTTSANPKFFSNGLDLDWVMSGEAGPDHPGGERGPFGVEFMTLMGRLILLPMPTVCAIGGHAFGAGCMLALTHDVRIMREDRGYLCANEMELGLPIPDPEIALFRHKLPAAAFHRTVMLAERWTGPTALGAGVIEATAPEGEVLAAAMERASRLAPLAAKRNVFGGQKRAIYGEGSILNSPHGAGYILSNAADYLDGH